MNKKGFTLIELLAVIVILAIIALIATPIILGIINDARQDAGQRSVELYASSIETQFIIQSLNGSETLPSSGSKVVPQSILDAVSMKNKPTDCIVTINSVGIVSLTNCTANGVTGLSTTTVIDVPSTVSQ